MGHSSHDDKIGLDPFGQRRDFFMGPSLHQMRLRFEIAHSILPQVAGYLAHQPVQTGLVLSPHLFDIGNNFLLWRIHKRTTHGALADCMPDRQDVQLGKFR